jgi:ADP-ribose pyrophosphatase YjhB (NUDIX family)
VQVGAYGDPGRDPRGWTVTVAYAAVVPSTELGVKAAVSSPSSSQNVWVINCRPEDYVMKRQGDRLQPADRVALVGLK